MNKVSARTKRSKQTARKAPKPGTTAVDRRLLAKAKAETAEGKPAKGQNLRLLERGERDLRRKIGRGEVISWHRLQAVRLRRVAESLEQAVRVSSPTLCTPMQIAYKEALSLAAEFDDMGRQYMAGKVVRP
jgi:hypothetical protein